MEMVEQGPWSKGVAQIAADVGVELSRGLDVSDAVRRLDQDGPNRLEVARAESATAIFVRQFRNLITALLVVALSVSVAFGETIDAAAIGAVVILNGLLGFAAELRAVRSMEALRHLGSVQTRVRRAGETFDVDSETLVVGDVVIVEAGDVVTADLRVSDSTKLQVDESTLTGESLPVSKSEQPLAVETPLFERRNLLFRGTSVIRGEGVGIVVATGARTELGRIATLVSGTGSSKTPIEEQLSRLGRRLIVLTLGVAFVPIVVGIASGRDALLMMQTGIALAVAAIPEGLPIVATIALARGMWRMAQKNAIVRRLSAVEALGATSVIFTDKTGTLTENRLTLEKVISARGVHELSTFDLSRDVAELQPELRAALEISVLCNRAVRAQADGDPAHGDPLEIALLDAGHRFGIDPDALRVDNPEIADDPFDPTSRRMATIHDSGSRVYAMVKGAPETVIGNASRELCERSEAELDESGRSMWLARAGELAESGYRVLAVARTAMSNTNADPYRDTTLVGLLGFVDPARSDVRPSIEACRRAGIDVVMVTGDHPATAALIAAEVGVVDSAGSARVYTGDALPAPDEILEAHVFSRVSPEQKLALVDAHQAAGRVVAMTGDGVNDAPALESADVGVAMGMRGTEVAREAADIVLRDDAFSTIVTAIEQGRVIFENIRRFVRYLLACNLSEVLVVTGALALSLPLPVQPLQILFLNLVTDVFPALALALGRGEPQVLERPPRDPHEAIATRQHWIGMGVDGLVITLSVLGALIVARSAFELSTAEAVTISFATLALAQLAHVFNVRDADSGLFVNDIVRNRWIWAAVVLCTVLVGAAICLPFGHRVLGTVTPSTTGWIVIVIASLVPLIVGQTRLVLSRR